MPGCDSLLREVARRSEVQVLLAVLQQLRERVRQVEERAALGCRSVLYRGIRTVNSQECHRQVPMQPENLKEENLPKYSSVLRLNLSACILASPGDRLPGSSAPSALIGRQPQHHFQYLHMRNNSPRLFNIPKFNFLLSLNHIVS